MARNRAAFEEYTRRYFSVRDAVQGWVRDNKELAPIIQKLEREQAVLSGLAREINELAGERERLRQAGSAQDLVRSKETGKGAGYDSHKMYPAPLFAVVFPIALSTSTSLGVSFLPFAIAIMMAASASFSTPIGYQCNLMVYGPGGYRFTDYFRVGIPLNLLMAAVSLVIVPLVWRF